MSTTDPKTGLPRVEEIRQGIISDLEVIQSLTESMKQNQAFSRTLDAQADTIIQRARQVKRNWEEANQHLNTYIQDESKAQLARRTATDEVLPVRDPVTGKIISNEPPTPSQVSGETKTVPAASTVLQPGSEAARLEKERIDRENERKEKERRETEATLNKFKDKP